MAQWDSLQVSEMAETYIHNMEVNIVKPYDLLEMYKEAIRGDDYMVAAAIDRALGGTNYKVKDTHGHIPSMNLNFWKDLSKARKGGFNGSYYQAPGFLNYPWSKEQLKTLQFKN